MLGTWYGPDDNFLILGTRTGSLKHLKKPALFNVTVPLAYLVVPTPFLNVEVPMPLI